MLGIQIHSATENAGAAWDFVERYITGVFTSGGFYFRTGREVFEEAAPCFKGDKDLDEVVGIIQSRIQIYLNERK